MFFIAQSSSNQTTPPIPNVADWGLALVIIYLVAKELWKVFQTKDELEAKLTNALIDDLRQSNKSNLIEQTDKLKELIAIQSREALGVEKLDKSIRDMMLTAQAENQTLKRESVGYIVESRHQLALIESKIDALHRRLDTVGVGSRKEDIPEVFNLPH